MPAEATVPPLSSFSPAFITDAAAAAPAGEMLYSGAAGAAGFRSSSVGSMELMAVPKRKVGDFVSLTFLEKKFPSSSSSSYGCGSLMLLLEFVCRACDVVVPAKKITRFDLGFKCS
jgi:hypothetical protein